MKYLKLFEDHSSAPKKVMYHITHENTGAKILEEGLKTNQKIYMSYKPKWAHKLYGCNPIYLSLNPIHSSTQYFWVDDQIDMSYERVALEVDVNGLEVLADLPSLKDLGGMISDDGYIGFNKNKFPKRIIDYTTPSFWPDGCADIVLTESFKNSLIENGNIFFGLLDEGWADIDELLNPNSDLTKAAINFTGTGVVLKDISPNRIKSYINPLIEEIYKKRPN